MKRLLRWLEVLFWVAGCAGIGWWAWVAVEAKRFQARESRFFDQTRQSVLAKVDRNMPAPPPDPSLVARLDIPRLGLSTIVREGVSARVLEYSAGHVPGTALPGERGNIAIAAHRDSFFRDLRKVVPNDLIRLETFHGEQDYKVSWIRIVDPEDTAVIQPTKSRALTLITCYPFYFVGPAPMRYVIRADEVAPPHGPARTSFKPPPVS